MPGQDRPGGKVGLVDGQRCDDELYIPTSQRGESVGEGQADELDAAARVGGLERVDELAQHGGDLGRADDAQSYRLGQLLAGVLRRPEHVLEGVESATGVPAEP